MAVPSSTYRLQITADFDLHAAAALTDYLVELGVGGVYVSPLLRAMPGSPHGYDVVDHTRVDPERGGDAGLRILAEACRKRGLSLVVDIVPNHMGVAAPAENQAWWQLLRLGPDAPTASWFDVDWLAGDGRILLPVLADDVDVARELTIVGDELHYYEKRFPIAPGTATGATLDVLRRQHYQLASYRRADLDQNYRRFFAVTDLAGLRVEDPAVFEATHREILRWVRDYGVSGIRVDHPDGLVDPGSYLQRLAAEAPDAWITIEKITEPGEQLPSSWPVAGMTGYDALAEVNAVLIDPAAAGAVSQLYVEVTSDIRGWEQHAADGKRFVATTILLAEIRRLARLVPEIDDAVAALTELAVAFPVYRSYLPLGAEHLAHAADAAHARRPELTPAIEKLMPRLLDPSDELALRFQQTTGAVMAKGVEDTAYYRYTRFIGLNEVGGYPGAFGLGVADFHAAQERRMASAPNGMTTLSTHDTKRGEDIRARLAVLAEMPTEWAEAARFLMASAPVPNHAFGYLLWQTFVATGLIERGRMHSYVAKAMREASDGTGWTDPDPSFEELVHAAVDAAYDRPEVAQVIRSIARRIDPYGWSNSLSQKLVQLTMPGVPDVYQGSELWEDSLVDPDNRRPVDFEARGRMLAHLTHIETAVPIDSSAAAKLWVTASALRARRDRPELFIGYQPLLVDGSAQDNAIAFDRGGAITVATRLPVGLANAGGWSDTSIGLPGGHYIDVLTGASFAGEAQLAVLLAQYPVALLLREELS
jgi:(1->4)-alpha-D-glucan 1-alpha-D-glucosylmutase